MNKKLIPWICIGIGVVIVVICCILLFQNTIVMSDKVNFTEVAVNGLDVTIKGRVKDSQVGDQITVVVYEKDKNSEDLTAVIYMDQETHDEQGDGRDFNFSFKVPDSAKGKSYNIKVSSSGLDNPVLYGKIIDIR
jgi:hypothetical protein